ncbi:Retrovirus-related Pol polyprotein from transposon TNT 1-94 [Cucumis melo var. makuwa]|uniref:Retrovirus-related Pol polyprotein from transposon TNT 1-94 n=1 Tax=Cucumis melo var. makuwa TaxID=1194695 RepID=A0A5A7VLL1_CUCMM|nr:Retrovirus-related Pol polyprotein from transposon TNT 1-94 [Cucumis melo var. makuwa]
MFLEGRHQFGFLTGETVRPSPGDALERLWKGEDSLIRSMLINSMEPQIGKPLLYAATAKVFWDTTQTLYSKRQNTSRLYTLRKQVHNCKQGTLDVTTYFNKLSLLWQEMDLCRETVWDTPNDSTQYAKLEEADRVYDFLAGLNPKFDNVCGRILGQRPLPSLMEVCFEVRLEENRTNAMGVLTTPTIDFAAFSARSSNHDSDKNNGKSIPVCEHSDGSLTSIAGKGQIVPFDGFALQNVLHVPKLSYNLLSISKITRELHCKAIFLPESVYFQDMSSGRTIGTARHSRGLYILDDDTSCSSLSRVSLLSFYFSTSEQDYKSEVPSIFQNFYHTIKTQFHTKIAILRSDNGREFQNHNLSEFLASKGIVHQTSCAYTLQQNGVAERKNRHLVEVARSLMLSTSLPSYLWGDAILTAAHLINRMPSRILHLQTPLDCLKESYPSTHFVSEVPLRVFGCTAYVHNFGPNQTKFTPRAQACVFVGYPLHQRGYKCFHPPSRKYFVTMDVTFCENRPYFPVSHLQGESVSEESNNTFEFVESTPITVSDIDPHPIILPTNQVPWKTYYRRNLRKKVGSPTSQPLAPVQDFEPPRDQGMENPTKPCTNNTMSENDKSDVAVLENMEENNRDDETEVRIETSNDEAEQSHTRKLDEYDPSLDIPIALRKGCKWVFSLKYKADGTLDRHKARLVAKGFTQTYGIDYSETFSPVAKLNTVRVLLSVAVNKDWPLYQLDVKNGFLNGDLVEEVYMSPRQDLKLNLSQGYSQGHSDHTLFTKASKTGKIVILIVYVDDIVLTEDDQTEISQLKQRMGDEFEIKDLGNLKYFLGMEVARSKEGIPVSQRKYTLDLLTEIGMLGCRPADTSIEFNCKLGNSDDQVPVDKEQYQRLVGKLIYLSHTRPDISFAVSVVSQFMQAPYKKHMEAVNRILRYLKNTPEAVVARSSAEAEYRAMSLGICEEIWLQKVLSDLHQECETPLKLFCDNKAATSIANNPIQHDRTKHVEIDRHFIKERLDGGSICILYIPSSQQIADVLTKGLLRPHFDLCVSKLGLIDIYVPT